MGDPLETLISGYWGEVVAPLTETCWSWLPSLPVVSLRDSPHALPDVIARLTTGGYEPIESDPLEIVCHHLGAGVLLLVHPDEYVETWATQETKLFAIQYPVVLGIPPLREGVPRDPTSIPPLTYGRMALRYDQPEPLVYRAEQLSDDGKDARLLLQTILEHLVMARERQHHPQLFEALMALFSGQLGSLITHYAQVVRQSAYPSDSRRRRFVRHGRHAISLSNPPRR